MVEMFFYNKDWHFIGKNERPEVDAVIFGSVFLLAMILVLMFMNIWWYICLVNMAIKLTFGNKKTFDSDHEGLDKNIRKGSTLSAISDHGGNLDMKKLN